MIVDQTSTLWHLPSQILLHNSIVGKGTVWSASALAFGELADITTPYAFATAGSAKEQLWEEVRVRIAPDAPTRNKALFAFLSSDDAKRANIEWFSGSKREPVRFRPLQANAIVVDARWLDKAPSDWESAATCYWNGNATADPRWEVILNGSVFLIDWQTFSLGPMSG